MQSLFCRTPPCGDSRPMDQIAASAGLQPSRSGVSRNGPCGSAGSIPARDGPSAPRAQRTRERGSPVCSTRDQCHLSDARSCRTAGCERGPLPMQVATRLSERRRSVCCGYSEEHRRKNRMSSLRVQAAMVRWGVATARQSGFSQLRLSVVQAKAISSATTPHIACNAVVNAFQQYEQLPSMATANMKRRATGLELAHPPMFANPHKY